MTEPEPTTGAATTTTTTTFPAPTDEQYAAARPWYAAEIARGVERFLEPRRDTCPWCGSTRLQTRLTTGDLLQRKPGRFTLDECRTCRHIFQNPRLTPDGLDFYYRDFYDGLGAQTTDVVLAGHTTLYQDRARMVAPFLTPRSWLDVGTGWGHFCQEARSIWPDTVFDGLDMGAGIEAGLARGWLDHIYRGSLPHLADQITGRYDVLSMHHYLEHVRDPRAELDVVAKVLAPGSYLLIEIPDPTSMLGRILGKWWVPWFQPQHQHLIPQRNLLQALTERGFTPVAVHRRNAHIPVDLTCAMIHLSRVAAPDPRLPWLGPPTPWRQRRHQAVLKVATRMFGTFCRADQAIAPLVRRLDGGNAYRVLARRNG